jgi:polysaccharide pyruvyl transferase WcaK-like protein
MNTRVLLIGFYGRRSFGDDLMAGALATFLRENLSVQLSIVADESYFTKSIRDLGAKRIPRRVGSVLSALRHCDILVQGGGSIFHDSYLGRTRLRYWKNLAMWLVLFLLARMAGTKVMLLGSGVGPIHHPVTHLLCRLALSCADSIMVRDQASLGTVRSLRLTRLPCAGFDLAVLRERDFARAIPERRERLVLGVAPCSLEPFCRDRNVAAHYWMELAEALGEFALRTGAQVRLFGLFTGYRFGSDEGTCRAMADRLPASVERELSLYPRNRHTFTRDLAGCDVLISARYHGLMAGFMSGSSLAAITYNRKVGDLARSIGLPEDCIIPADRLLSREFWLAKLNHLVKGEGEPTRRPCDLARTTRNALADALGQLRTPAFSAHCAKDQVART